MSEQQADYITEAMELFQQAKAHLEAETVSLRRQVEASDDIIHDLAEKRTQLAIERFPSGWSRKVCSRELSGLPRKQIHAKV